MSYAGPPQGAPLPQPAGPPPGWPAPPRSGTPLLVAGAVLMVAAVVVGIWVAVRAFSPVLNADPQQVGEGHTLQAEAGQTYAVYSGARGDTAEGCQVRDPSGGQVPSETPFGTEQLTLQGRVYFVARVFTAQVDGPHTVTCPLGRYAVGERIGVVGVVLGVLAAGFGGLVAFLLGLVLAVVGWGRRRQARNLAAHGQSLSSGQLPQTGWPGAPGGFGPGG